MRNPQRIPRILNKLQKIWEKSPDLRFGQMIYNMYATNQNVRKIRSMENGFPVGMGVDPFHYEDSEFEEYLDELLR